MFEYYVCYLNFIAIFEYYICIRHQTMGEVITSLKDILSNIGMIEINSCINVFVNRNCDDSN